MKAIEQSERYTLSKLVAQNLKQYILDQKLAPGDKLPAERELSLIMNVSRAILREALRSMESSGILEIRHGEGSYVANRFLSPLIDRLSFQVQMMGTSHHEIREIRFLLESAALDAAAGQTDPAFHDNLDRLAMTAAESDPEADISFHMAVIRAQRNDSFTQLAEFFIRLASSAPVPSERSSLEEHREYAAALRKQDIDGAKKILRKHLGMMSEE